MDTRTPLSLTFLLLLAGLIGCKKTPETLPVCGPGLQSATVVSGRNGCVQNDFLLQLDGGAAYPPDSLPTSLQQLGLRVCVAYGIYEDPRMCPCCGGRRLRILRIQKQ